MCFTHQAWLLPAVCLLFICSCSRPDNSDKSELVKVRVELEETKAELDEARTELAELKDLRDEETKVLDSGIEFITDLQKNQLASAYRSTSESYQTQVERAAFDEMISSTVLDLSLVYVQWS